VVGISPPSAPRRKGAGLDQVGDVLRTSYQEEEPENLDGRLTALMLQLSIDPPEGAADAITARPARTEVWTVMATMARTCWAGVMRLAVFSFRRRVH
jgi:hypothetical protein